MIFCGLALFSSPSLAADFYLRTGEVTNNRPNGFPSFCAKYPSDCGSPGRLTKIAKADWKEVLLEINTETNDTVRYQAEGPNSDDWHAAGRSGDCEDFAILKRRKLIEAGVPAASMRFAFVKSDKLGLHVVLVVRTDDGDRVLDNDTNAINPPNKTPYDWISVQSRWNPRNWLTVE